MDNTPVTAEKSIETPNKPAFNPADNLPKYKGMPKRTDLYQSIGRKRKKIIKTLFECLDSNNPSIRLGAAKILINKLLPDLKAVELTGDTASQIVLNVIKYGATDPINKVIEATEQPITSNEDAVEAN